MPPVLLILLCFTSFMSHSLTFKLPTNLKRAPPPNPLPPPPPPPPLGPDNYPVPGTDLRVRVDRPWGGVLPHGPTILCLATAQSVLDRQIAARGDVEFPLLWNFEDGGIKLIVLRLDREEFHLSAAITLLRSMVELMTQYPEMGTRAVNAIMLEPGNVIGRVEISRGRANLDETYSSVFNASQNLTAYDPTNYRVPHTHVTVSLEGKPPYGSPLPKDSLILILSSAQASASRMVQQFGDPALPSLWRFEEGDIGIDIHTDLRVDCHYSVLQTGLLGLVDLINEPGGVGAVAADFILKVDGKREVARGRLKLLGSGGPAQIAASGTGATVIEQSKSTSEPLVGGAATVIEQAESTSRTLIGGAVQTGNVATA